MGVRMYEVYGQTENAGLATSNYPGHLKVGTIGQTAPGTELKLSPQGEILLRGPHVFKGYLNKPEKTAEALQGRLAAHRRRRRHRQCRASCASPTA